MAASSFIACGDQSVAQIAGTWAVTEHRLDPSGCTDGEPQTSLERFSIMDCGDGRALLLRGESSSQQRCGIEGDLYLRQGADGRFVGERTTTMLIERPTGNLCAAYSERIDARVDRQSLILELRSFEAHRSADSSALCPTPDPWADGQSTTGCTRRETIVGERVP